MEENLDLELDEQIEDIGSDEEVDWKAKAEELEAKMEELARKNESAEDVAKRLKDEKSQSKRQEVETQKQQEMSSKKNEFINANIQSFIENGMVATDEQLAQAKELGITPEQIELASYKARDNVQKIYGIVGGKDEYNSMLDTMAEHLTDAEKDEYTKAIQNPNLSTYAVKGLYADYLKLSGKEPNVSKDNRIVANVSAKSTGGVYSDMQEYYADMRKMRSMPSTEQSGFYKQIQAKVNRSNLV